MRVLRDSLVYCVAGWLTLAMGISASAANWPGWRGPEGTGIASDKDLPLKWSGNENVRWRVDLPGPGNSSPIVWGDRVFVTQAVGSENRRAVMCFDRATGKRLWQSGVVYDDKEPTQPSNPYCSATPVTDGERIIALFGSAGLYCYDLAGKELWHRCLGKMSHMFGNASSLVLYGDLCVLYFGPDEKARLIAVNKRTGQNVWEAEPPKVDPSEQQAQGGPGGPGGPRGPGGPSGPGDPGGPGGGRGPGGSPSGSWSTPIVVRSEGRDELIMGFPYRLAAYDPKTGTPLWVSKGLGDSIYTTPLWGQGILVAISSGLSGVSAIAVRPGGSGDVTETHRLWRLDRIKSQIGSGVICDGYIYSVDQDGRAACNELRTGNAVWEEPLKGPGAKGSSWSSMLLADGRIYVTNQSGDVFVLRAGPRFEVPATNSVGEPTNATLAASNGELFMRTDKSLWCLANTPQGTRQ